jgi:methylated-DNA-[protein]-cysteine S-methyltransferase
MHTCYTNTPIGIAEIQGNDEGIASVTVLNFNSKEEEDAFLKKQDTIDIPELLQDCVYQLNEYFQGERKRFSLKLNPKGTPFQQNIWKLLEHIPYGKSMSYLALAKQFGDVKAIRAVAGANGKNPLWIIVPCHRVIGSDGSLTGYAGGLYRKQWLLNHESPVKQQSLF